MQPVTEKEMLEMVKKVLEFPYPQICKHLVACDLLQFMESKGYPLSQELAGAVVRAEDDIAIALLVGV